MSAELLRLKITLERGDFSLDMDEALSAVGVTAVFGPSGSGKSSLLRSIAGFETPNAGHISLGDDIWFDSDEGLNTPPYMRAIGFMFQDARLFPHLDVAGNLAFAERRSRALGTSFQMRDLIEVLDLEALLPRRVDKLSGGESGRVALARTLLTRPRLLLLDEPLSALDRERKAEILPYLDRAQERFSLPTLYVSHDIDEVAHIADHVLVLMAGRAVMRGSAIDIFNRLDVAMLGDRLDPGVLIEGRIDSHDDEINVTRVDIGGDLLTMARAPHLAPGRPVRLRIRAKDVALATKAPEGISIRNVLPATLIELQPGQVPGQVDARIRLRRGELRARLTEAAVADLDLVAGTPVFALVKSVGLSVS